MKVQRFLYTAILGILSIFIFNASASAQQLNSRNLTKNVTPVTEALNYIKRLKPVTYEYNQASYKQLNLPRGKHLGFIADDVKLVVPAAVSEKNTWFAAGKNNQQAVTTLQTDLEKLVPLLVAAVKEQQAEIEKLRTDLEQLKAGK